MLAQSGSQAFSASERSSWSLDSRTSSASAENSFISFLTLSKGSRTFLHLLRTSTVSCALSRSFQKPGADILRSSSSFFALVSTIFRNFSRYSTRSCASESLVSSSSNVMSLPWFATLYCQKTISLTFDSIFSRRIAFPFRDFLYHRRGCFLVVYSADT